MKKQTLLRNISTLASSIALFAAVSCTPVPYTPGAAYQGANSSGAIVGTDVGRGSTLSPPSAAYREDQERRNSQSYNSTRTYTPPSERPTYTPPAPRSTYTPPAPRLPTTTARSSSSSTPMATPSIKKDTVISPYPPYNVLDTTGASSGDKLCDPSTIPIDPSTGKQYINPNTGLPDVKRGKYFIVP